MENNNFYLGNIYHKRKFKQFTIDNLVLYTEDKCYYLDLLDNRWYTTDTNKKDFVIENSLRQIDISELRTDYNYLLNKYKSRKKVKQDMK